VQDSSSDARTLLAHIEAAAVAAADFIRARSADRSGLEWRAKSATDFVSDVDTGSERLIADALLGAFPHARILGEELSPGARAGARLMFIVDPLDGTTNFLHGVPHWCISIALEQRRADGGSDIIAGMIYSPAVDEMFWAERGVGAFVNERRLRVAARRDIKDALFATGIPFAAVSAPRRLAFARTLGTLMPQVAGIRRFGAAALDLAWVAAGRYDGYWELGLKPWDMAAGMLIVREAGGFVTDAGGREAVMYETAANDIVAANPHLHPRLLEVVADGVSAAEGRAA
jgi:myo-inositol-1(or 4)-monophosphatase